MHDFELTVSKNMKNQDPVIPANIVIIWLDKKICLQNCIAEKIKIDERNEITRDKFVARTEIG